MDQAVATDSADSSNVGLFYARPNQISRMIAYHQNFTDGQFPPVWAKEVLGGIGSPVLMLNYQLPYYFSEIFVRG